MPRVQPDRTALKKFLDSAIIDPNKKGNMLEQTLVESGEPAYFEVRVVEYMTEAKRIRERMKTAHGKGLATLVEEYNLVLRKAATNLAVAACKVSVEHAPPPPRPIKVVPPVATEGTEAT